MRVRRAGHMKRPAHCMEFVSDAMEISQSAGQRKEIELWFCTTHIIIIILLLLHFFSLIILFYYSLFLILFSFYLYHTEQFSVSSNSRSHPLSSPLYSLLFSNLSELRCTGTAANVIVQHPHNIKFANCLARAVLISNHKSGKRCSIEGQMLLYGFFLLLFLLPFSSPVILIFVSFFFSSLFLSGL